jgi:ABC-2 type transport system permease protein
MSATTDVLPVPVAPPSKTRPFYWSVRRELWENPAIWIGPLAAAAVVLVGFMIRTIGLADRMRTLSALGLDQQRAALAMPYSLAATLVILAAYLVGVFYSLDALHGERRDRGILFWKSLPVSDLTTVLAKASIPLVVLPLVALTIGLATQMAMLAWSTVVLSVSGGSAATLWARLPLLQLPVVMVYGVAVHALWHAPLYAWLLLVSAWARRMTFLWAVLPPLAIVVFERIVFPTPFFCTFLRSRFIGATRLTFDLEGQQGAPISRLGQIDPARFLLSPGLWLGLLAAAAFLAAAARLRRLREPI